MQRRWTGRGGRVAGLGAGLAVASTVLVIATQADAQDCSTTVWSPAAVSAALDATAPGDTLCLAGDEFATVDLDIEVSGEDGSPVTIEARDEVVIRSVRLAGSDLVLRGFTVHRGNGISCEDCHEVLIESNTVTGADGTGIDVSGDRITVHDNTVRGTRMREATDADGIRFFGTGHRITANRVEDITDDGYVGEGPHTDCFQTFDNGGKPVVDIEISGNVCRRVDHQCLIATAEQAGQRSMVGRSRSIDFHDNVCEVGAHQAVLVRWIPDVDIRDNRLGAQRWGAVLTDGSVDGSVRGNVLLGDIEPYLVDPSSRPGFEGGDNVQG